MTTARASRSFLPRIERLASFALVISLGVAVQVLASLQWKTNFDSDEVIIGLMARHTLQGKPPVYHYGQTYLGSLDALLSAPFVHWMGYTVVALRLSSLLLFELFLIMHGAFVYRRWGQ